MSTDHPHQSMVTERFEIYMAVDAERLYNELEEDPTADEIYPPGYGVSHTSITQTGVNSFTDEVAPLGYFVAGEPGYEDDIFCWHHGISDQLQNYEEWFEQESIYDQDERGDLRVMPNDVPIDVTLESAGCVTIVVDYVANYYSGDDYMFRAQLFYGGPWDTPEDQYLAITVHSKHLPESLPEALGVIEVLLANNPVDDIPLCIFDEDQEGDDIQQSDPVDDRDSGDTEE